MDSNRILYIAFIREDSESIGFVKKVMAQSKAFSQLGLESYLYISANDHAKLYKIVEGKVNEVKRLYYSSTAVYKDSKFPPLKIRNYFRFKQFIKHIKLQIAEINPSKVYIRRVRPITQDLVNLGNHCFSRGIKVFFEFPDFPHTPFVHPANKNIQSYLKYYHEKIFFKRLEKYLYKIVVISVREDFKNDKFLYLRNGIEVESIPMLKKEIESGSECKKLNLIGVANVGFWHAYDRVIQGMAKHYKNSGELPIHFHIVGEGAEIPNLKELVNGENLNEHVTFHGSKTGKALDEVFEDSHIGVGILGNHRKGLYGDSSLKNREYCARGIPFIKAAKDLDFPEDFPFSFNLPADNTPLSIGELIKFYNNLGNSFSDKEYLMREYALSHLTWKSKMEVVARV
ncbi:glycosyl transferase family 1 [Priestia aryabhattai]|uniref:glycosyl transferase family 1 n=1 Tax=Priestia aryabhattai TaxID=412384 RepID=UPI0020425343|nr:glycosyl transferase family 1 [Priestia aryabhattai]MCM3640627.1 glycosyl transferase family 1 [Priestia aryabhattai]MED4013707.1 glycosyl transferase family 1 [Priestia aryabhattai]